jgi:hypothetical protein
MPKEFLKIWFEDLQDAEEFFDGNQKHLGEFMVNVYRSYAELPTCFTCKLVEKYFKTYLKHIAFVKNAKEVGKNGGWKAHENKEVTDPTLVGYVVGSVLGEGVGVVLPKEKREKRKEINKENFSESFLLKELEEEEPKTILVKDYDFKACTLKEGDPHRHLIESGLRLFAFFKNETINNDLYSYTLVEWLRPLKILLKNYTREQIEELVEYANKDKFWNAIILNTDSLQKNFEKIKIQYKNYLNEKQRKS